ncbi:MAG: nitric oxide reductase activation protein NorD, partial [Nitrospiraceae bacterium]
LPDLDPAGQPDSEPARATVSPDGRMIALPAILRRYPTREENIRLYTVMTAHEAGHLEFGTYSLSLGRLVDLIEEVRRRYGGDKPSPHPSPIAHCNLESNGQPGEGQSGMTQGPRIQSLKELFALYPQPGLVRDLWTVLEDARVEYRLQHEYPGLKRDLAVLAREAVRTRSLTHGVSVREMIVDCLLLLTTADPGTVRIPDSIADIVERLWGLCQRILTPTASAEETIRLVDRLYLTMEEMLPSTACDVGAHEEQASDQDLGPGPKASEEVSGQYRPVTNWAYRGAMNPDLVRDHGGGVNGTEEERTPEMPTVGRDGFLTPDASRPSGEPVGNALGPELSADSPVDRLLTVGNEVLEERATGRFDDRGFLYDEWDGLIQDYRSGWCRVVERVAPEGSRDFAEATLAAHGPAVRLLRRYFESIRPPGLRRVHGQPDGEELDLDASIRRIADRAAGAEPSDRIYLRREKRERDVAAAFLVDLSGSTSRQIESPAGSSGRRVIDVEKEGLVLLCEALEAIGDQYGVYGYSGRGREQVEFVVLKEFDEPAHGRAAQRIGSIVPMHQNRDGAAIRHAAHKLLARNARVRLLVLISDGKPLDDGYADEYALEDTKMALREARIRGIEPFCITVDRSADDYLRRMYGEVRYVIIDHVAALPERLPRIYQRLTS